MLKQAARVRDKELSRIATEERADIAKVRAQAADQRRFAWREYDERRATIVKNAAAEEAA